MHNGLPSPAPGPPFHPAQHHGPAHMGGAAGGAPYEYPYEYEYDRHTLPCLPALSPMAPPGGDWSPHPGGNWRGYSPRGPGPAQGRSGGNKRQRRPAQPPPSGPPAVKMPKTLLNDLYTSQHLAVSYEVKPVLGPNGAPVLPHSYICNLTCPAFCSNELGPFQHFPGGVFTAQANSKKASEHAAAAAALEAIGLPDGSEQLSAQQPAKAPPQTGQTPQAGAATPATPKAQTPTGEPSSGAPAADAGTSNGDAQTPAAAEPDEEALRADPELLMQKYREAVKENESLKAELQTERAERLEDRDMFKRCLQALARD